MNAQVMQTRTPLEPATRPTFGTVLASTMAVDLSRRQVVGT